MTVNVKTLTSSAATVAENESITLTATVEADGGDNVDNATVNWVLDKGNELATLAGTTSTTGNDTQGTATMKLTGSTAGDVTVRAYTDADTVTGGQTADITVTAAPAAGGKVQSCTVPFQYFPADSSIPVTATAVVTDDSRAPVAGVEVTWTLSDNASADDTTSVTNANGVATLDVTFSAQGQATIQATTANDSEGQTASLLALTPSLPELQVSNADAADNWTLNHYDIIFGVEAEVPSNASILTGYAIYLCWGNQKLERIIQDPDTDLPLVVSINKDSFPGGLTDGAHPAFYYMTDSVGNPSLSTGLPITVADGGQTAPTLPEPSIPLADSDGSINMADSYNVTVEIAYPDMAKDDLVTLYWQAFTSGGLAIPAASGSWPHPVTADEVTAGTFTMDIPSSLFYPVNGAGYEGKAQVYYTALPAGGALALSETNSIIVDTVPTKA